MKTSHGTQWGRQKEEGGAKAERERERDSERGRRRSDVSFSSFYSLSSMHATERVCIITSGADVSFHRDELKVKISAFCLRTHTLTPFFFWWGGNQRPHAHMPWAILLPRQEVLGPPRLPWHYLPTNTHIHTHMHFLTLSLSLSLSRTPEQGVTRCP